jgi:ArsR family transcriptional regulator, arsenate/arsenite/antimonite-responsive transcriptional repressor
MDEMVNSLKALSDELRVRILLLLVDREACVCELMSVFRMPQSKLSHHLITLRDAGLLQDTKRGKWNYYRAETKLFSPLNRDLLLVLSGRYAESPVTKSDRDRLEKTKESMRICA